MAKKLTAEERVALRDAILQVLDDPNVEYKDHEGYVPGPRFVYTDAVVTESTEITGTSYTQREVREELWAMEAEGLVEQERKFHGCTWTSVANQKRRERKQQHFEWCNIGGINGAEKSVAALRDEVGRALDDLLERARGCDSAAWGKLAEVLHRLPRDLDIAWRPTEYAVEYDSLNDELVAKAGRPRSAGEKW